MLWKFVLYSDLPVLDGNLWLYFDGFGISFIFTKFFYFYLFLRDSLNWFGWVYDMYFN